MKVEGAGGALVDQILHDIYAMEPGSLIMERKMLLGIKDRAERLAHAEAGPRPVAGRNGRPHASAA